MIIKSIRLLNFRSCRGDHTFDVTPGLDGSGQPVVLFGGLNGAGKTSILLGVKLALYGRLSLGKNVSVKKLEAFIEDSIHRPKNISEPLRECGVGLTFSFDKQGRDVEYEVFRSWSKKRKSYEETISILENGKPLAGMGTKQSEGFLNQLVPLGVSDLFFFDGEKIAELAEDENGFALASAIKKMLGVELVERLRADLRVFLLSNAEGKFRSSNITAIADETEAFLTLKQRIKQEEMELEELLESYQTSKNMQADLELRLIESGGDYAKSRQDQQKLGDSLASQADGVRRELRDTISGLFPLALADQFIGELSTDVEKVVEREKAIERNAALSDFALKLKSAADPISHEKIDEVLDLTTSAVGTKPKFYPNVSQGDVDVLSSFAATGATDSRRRVADQLAVLERLEQDLESTALKIDRAPDDRSLQEQLAEVVKATTLAEAQRGEVVTRLAEIKLLYDKAQELARGLKRQHEVNSTKDQIEAAFDLAVRSREVLLEFSEKRVARKIDALQEVFVNTFDRLMRKRGSIQRAEIDAKTFSVELFATDGARINKNKLSAGEKQIYAVAMLDALARTSGNHLPIIIDTPLGRLDSEHRNKLVNQYFPSASHQVILLSTDTEIDLHHYSDLQRHCAKRLHITFDQESGCSSVEEGYFFQPVAEEVV